MAKEWYEVSIHNGSCGVSEAEEFATFKDTIPVAVDMLKEELACGMRDCDKISITVTITKYTDEDE